MSGVDLSGLNDAQRSIATTLDAPLFVEAGAGSGKTFTLTRRVVWALSEGSGTDGRPFLDDLSQVLVITFTNAAAREIKERVRKGLRDAGMHEAALAVDSAWISTIHGMCQRILKRNALELGLDPSFGVCGTHQQLQLLDAAIERAVDDARRRARADRLVACAFEELEYTGVVTRVQALVNLAHASVGGFDALRVYEADNVATAMDDLTRSFEALGSAKLSAAARKAVDPSLDALREFAGLPPAMRTAKRALTALESCKAPRSSKAIADLVAEAKDELTYAKALMRLACTGELAPVLLGIARATEEYYVQLKRSRALLDNDDLITLALEAVSGNPVVARRYAGRFRLVMVDEFQDTDAKQLQLISLLAGGGRGDEPRHLATVGDAQQSIYRFRGADVSVFNARGARVPAEGHVRLDINYRSHADVLAFVDKVCGGDDGVLDDFMHLDANPLREDSYQASGLPRIAVEIASSQSRGVSSRERTEQLARQVANRLKRYCDAGEKAGRMALLLGSTTHADVYIDALRAAGMECVVTGGSTFTKASEVGVMLALLRTLANPHDTQSGLFPLLSSEMFELDANDFLQLGTCRQAKLDAPTKRPVDRGLLQGEALELFGGATPSSRLAHARDVLRHALEAVATHPIADVCMDVVRSSGWLSRLEAQGAEGVAKEANVLAAVRYIRDLSAELGLGPSRAAAEFAHWLEVTKVPPASLAGAEQNTVRVMTIHASKGLEFPVTVVAECWNNPRQDGGLWSQNADDGSVDVVLVPKGGVKLEGADEACGTGDLVDVACGIKESVARAEAQEKARLLYVALTRAREALVLALGVTVSAKAGISSGIAAGVVDALFGGGLPPEGECLVEYGGSAPASVRHVALEAPEKNGGPLQRTEEARSVDLFAVEHVGCDEVVLQRARTDVFSYSSVLADEARHAVWTKSGRRPPTPRRGEREAIAVGEAVLSDDDKATNLGSAFHMIAQAMVEAKSGLDTEHVSRICRCWGLSARQRGRLDVALHTWQHSNLRREALSWGLVRAEVPFFALSGGDPHGAYVEGAIDLLCTDGVACEGSALVVDYKTGDIGLDEAQVHARHFAQAELYAKTLLSLGFSSVECAFICVETGVVARYSW